MSREEVIYRLRPESTDQDSDMAWLWRQWARDQTHKPGKYEPCIRVRYNTSDPVAVVGYPERRKLSAPAKLKMISFTSHFTIDYDAEPA
jgi:hypothetical protein